MIPNLDSLRYTSPTGRVGVHTIFDMVARRLTPPPAAEGQEHAVALTVATGLCQFGMAETAAARVWSEPGRTADELERALVMTADRADALLLDTLWSLRLALSALPLSWDDVIEGHPVLGRLTTEDRADLLDVAAGVLETARRGLEMAYEIDLRIARIYGAPDPSATVSYAELVRACPDAAALSALYGKADFDV